MTASSAGGAVSPTTTYRLVLPWSTPPLTQNQRHHWSVRNRKTREIRETVAWLAKAARIPVCEHLTVQLVWAPGDRRRRDGDNCAPTVKACVDALARGPRKDLIGLDLVPDDTPEHVTVLPTLIEPPPHEPGLWLIVETRGGSDTDGGGGLDQHSGSVNVNGGARELTEWQQIVRFDWVVTRTWNRLHHVDLSSEQWASWGPGEPFPGPIRLSCGRTAAVIIVPGFVTRMGAMRCVGCCRAVGYPAGKGSPKNSGLGVPR